MIRSFPMGGSGAALVLLVAAGAAAQDQGPPLPLLTDGTVTVIAPDPPAAGVLAAAPPPAPPPTPEETLDEAAEALVQMLTADGAAGPPMAECAVDLLRSRLATAAEGDDVLTAIALENELLSLCNQRQQLVLEVLSTELLLASLIAGESPAAPPAAPPETPWQTPPAATLDQITAIPAAQTPAPEAAPAAHEPPPEPTSPGLAWVTVLGSAGNLRAAVSDGASVWWVREGDVLPGGWRVTRIAAQPPGVTLSHADAGHHALPFHSGPAPGAGP